MRRLIASLLFFQSIVFVSPSIALDNGKFTLTIKLQDVYNPDFKIQTDLKIDEPFQIKKSMGAIKNTISGVLHPSEGERYPLTLNISEWKSKTENSKETVKLDLELDKPWSGGTIQSTVNRRTVVLSRQKP